MLGRFINHSQIKVIGLIAIFGEEIKEVYCSLLPNFFVLCLPFLVCIISHMLIVITFFFLVVIVVTYFIFIARLIIKMGFTTWCAHAKISLPLINKSFLVHEPNEPFLLLLHMSTYFLCSICEHNIYLKNWYLYRFYFLKLFNLQCVISNSMLYYIFLNKLHFIFLRYT